MKFKIIYILFLIFLSVFINLNRSAEYSFDDFENATIVITWNNLLLRAIHNASPPPTIVARSLALVHTAIYDAWSSYNNVTRGVYLLPKNNIINSTSTTTQNEMDNLIKKSISYAAYNTLKDLYPLSIEFYNQKMNDLGYDINDNNLEIDNAAGIGNLASKVLLENRWYDGSNQKAQWGGKNYSDWTNFEPSNKAQPESLIYPDSWQPLLVPVRNSTKSIAQSFSTPQWGSVKPFSLKHGAQFRPLKPPPYALNNKTVESLKSSAWELVNFTQNMTDRIKAIAEYWGDGPLSVLPPGHWNFFAQFVSQRDQNSIEKDVKMFFMLNNAALDASIACWDCKRFFNNARPATMIPYLLKGNIVTGWNGVCKDNVTFDLKDWIPYQDPYVITPPFPDYTSGHSTFSSSAAQILKRFTGSDKFGNSVTIKAGSSLFENNCSYPVPRTDVTLYWDTFSDAADEAGISRRYGGIHYDFSDLIARNMGRQIGNSVWDRSQLLFRGLDPDNINNY